MIFSKTFGYALRSVLYIAATGNETEKIRVEDISRKIGIPKYFLAKIMNKMAKGGIVSSTKGPNGGFSITNKTLDTPLIRLYQLVDGPNLAESCVLNVQKKCDESHPCPMHFKMVDHKENIMVTLSGTTISDLLGDERTDLVQSISFWNVLPRAKRFPKSWCS